MLICNSISCFRIKKISSKKGCDNLLYILSLVLRIFIWLFEVAAVTVTEVAVAATVMEAAVVDTAVDAVAVDTVAAVRLSLIFCNEPPTGEIFFIFCNDYDYF